MRLLVVEDDRRISEPLAEGLAREGYEVVVVATGAAALAAEPVDLVLLDLGLPDLEGRVVCQGLRARSDVPIIVVTARGDEIDRVMLLEIGADDYVVKPFGFRELVARIRAVSRRASAASPVLEATLRVGALTIDRRAHAVEFQGTAISLTPKEYDLLIYLAADPGAVKSREQLMHDVWDENWWGSTKTLDVHVASLRKKLAPELVETVRAVGYRLVELPAAGDAVTRRLVFSYLAITVFVLLLLELPLAVFYADRERERIAADLEHDANVIATIYEDDLENDRTLDPAPAEEYEERTGARTVVVDRDGVSVVDTASPTNRDFSTRPEVAQALHGEQATGTRSSDTLASDIMYVAVPVASGGIVHGAVRVTIDTGDVVGRIHRFWTALAVIAVVTVGLVALVGWGLARSVTRPVRRLQAAALRFAAGDLAIEEQPSRGPPELRSLSDAMSTMARRLDGLLAAQRSFVADASHELRTPLTALRLRLENLQSRLPAASSAELDAAIEETDRLRLLVNNLLQLARADERPATAAFDLARLTADRVDTWTAVADIRGVGIRCDGVAEPVVVTAVPGSIEQILDNLLDNALDAAPVGSLITATVSIIATERAQLRVVDHGTGLDDAQKANAPRRFWRGDATHPGTGLGLAIVDTLTTASGGSFTLEDTPGGGLTAIATLPLAVGLPVRHLRKSRPTGTTPSDRVNIASGAPAQSVPRAADVVQGVGPKPGAMPTAPDPAAHGIDGEARGEQAPVEERNRGRGPAPS